MQPQTQKIVSSVTALIRIVTAITGMMQPRQLPDLLDDGFFTGLFPDPGPKRGSSGSRPGMLNPPEETFFKVEAAEPLRTVPARAAAFSTGSLIRIV